MLDLSSTLHQVFLMECLRQRDGTVVVANNKAFFPLQTKLALPWLLGIHSVQMICSKRNSIGDSPLTIAEVREGLIAFAKLSGNSDGLVFSCSEDVDAELQLVRSTRLPY
jgi:hypothetical protein